MRIPHLSLFALILSVLPAAAADDAGLETLATCRASWLEWQKANDPKLEPLAAHLRAAFTQKEGEAYIVPKAATTIAGLRVLQVYPSSAGMGVGFTVLVDATFDKARATFEKNLGKSLGHCETGDGMHACELELAPQRSFMLMTSDKPGDTKSLVGCYYYYEK